MAFVPKLTINETDEGFIHPYSQTPFATREAMWADLQQNFSPNHDWQRQDIEYVEQATEGQDYTRFRPDPPPPDKRADFVEEYTASERREAQLKQDRLNYPDAFPSRSQGSRAALDAGHQHPGHTPPRGAGTYMMNQQTGRGEWVPDQAPDDPNDPWGEEDMIESETTPEDEWGVTDDDASGMPGSKDDYYDSWDNDPDQVND
jgi:hypothetical protein